MVLTQAALQAAVVASILLLPEEVSEVPPQATSKLLDRPAMRPLMMVRFMSSPESLELSQASLVS